MAGIGFSLNRLFSKKGIWNICKAYGYASVITAGPMILGTILLLGVSFVSKIGGMAVKDRELLNSMITYGLLLSLTITSIFNLSVTRFISDNLYERKNEKIMPSFLGVIAIESVLCLLLYLPFLINAGITVAQIILCQWFALVLIVVWTEMIYITALKDYQAIVLAFTISMMLGFLLALLFVLAGVVTVESMLFCVIVAYGLLAVRYYEQLLRYFTYSSGSHFSFLGWFDKYRTLTLSGIFCNIGLFGHIVIMYFGPLRVQVQGLFFGAPQYDVPALIAFFSLLVTTVSFVTTVEVQFYPKYSNYYGLFNDRGAIKDIQLAEKEMRTVLAREMTYLGHKQLFTSLLFIVVAPPIIKMIIPGISNLSISIFQFLCVGYGTYALANSMMLIMLYFEDYRGALIGNFLFALFSCTATIWQILHGKIEFFGMGFFAGTIIYYIFVSIRLSWYTRRLPYYLLARQSILVLEEKGPLVRLSRFLEKRQQKMKLFVLFAVILLSLSGCKANSLEASLLLGEQQTEPTVTEVEKEELKETTVKDEAFLYQNEEDASVIKMYLTVSTGNEADGSNHTWTEVNSYSAEYYTNLGIDRYKVEGILQIDDGEGLGTDSFGYEEKVPNVTVQVRGQTSSRNAIKNYKVRIKDGKGNFDGQRTLNLNKHISDPYRFTNKLCYNLINRVPELIGGRTQFVHLFVKDNTEGGDGEFHDYGLYTMVEQVNKTYLKNRGWDENGQLYKVTFFEWNEYEAVSTPVDSPDFDLAEFEKYLEIKGDMDTAKLNRIVEKIGNKMIPIEDIIEEHFDPQNICYWMALNILLGNYDAGARNFFLYSPLNSEKFYFLCWDMDASLRKGYMQSKDYSEGLSWERGMSQYLGMELTRRMLKEECYRNMLTAAVLDLHENYINCETVSILTEKYSEVTRSFLYEGADIENAKISLEVFDELTGLLGKEIEDNFNYYFYSENLPWPFYVGLPERKDNKMVINWDASYDIGGEALTYDYVLARDYYFTDVISEGYGLIAPSVSIGILPPGVYFIRVRATNESGYTQDCFDYYNRKSGGKVYGCMAFEVLEDGSSKVYTKRE